MIHWLWLQNALGHSASKIQEIINKYGTAENIYKSDINSLRFSGLFSDRALSRLEDKSLDEARKVLNDCKNYGITIIPYTSQNYPNCLRQISCPPLLLYAKGNLSLLGDIPRVTVVGPREVSTYGKKAGYSLAARLSMGGITIVSGGAIGGDTSAHKGALVVKSPNICILPCGLNNPYPRANEYLRKEILDNNGLLISEFSPNTSVNKYSFHIRNRILSGISLATVVIEAGEKSGTLITANHANEQGRDVFVILGVPGYPQYKGSNMLLRDGARLLLSAQDIFDEYEYMYPDIINSAKAYKKNPTYKDDEPAKTVISRKNEKAEIIDKKITKKIITECLSNNAIIVYNNLNKQSFYADEINIDNMSNTEIIAALGELEIYGYISLKAGGKYIIKS